MRLDVLRSLLLIHVWAWSAQASDGVSCSKQSTLPTLQYTISPDFIWLPSDVTAADLAEKLKASNAQFEITTDGKSKGVITSRIQNFLQTPCTMRLVVTVESWASAQQCLGLLNETLSSTDLMCRLATHKLGKTYEDNSHIMLSSRLKADIIPPAPKTPTSQPLSTNKIPPPSIKGSSLGQLIKRSLQRRSYEVLSDPQYGAAGFDYSITCPRLPTANAETNTISLEGVKGLFKIRDCSWCQKAVTELQSVCGSNAEDVAGIGNVANYLKKSGWSYGGGICEHCS
jgi:hypothetical protein